MNILVFIIAIKLSICLLMRCASCRYQEPTEEDTEYLHSLFDAILEVCFVLVIIVIISIIVIIIIRILLLS